MNLGEKNSMACEKLRKTRGKEKYIKKRKRSSKLKREKEKKEKRKRSSTLNREVEKFKKKRCLKCMLIELACVVADAHVEIYYHLILFILLDYSFIYGLKYRENT